MTAALLTTTPTDERDEWRTPGFVFDYFNRRFGFVWDLAATDGNPLCDNWITRGRDALAMSWADALLGGPGWCNPPYSHIDPWLAKATVEAAARGFTSVFLIPTPNGESRYGDHVFGVASEVWFITGRLAFLRPDGTPVPGNRWGSMVAVYRGHDLGNTRLCHVHRDEMQREAPDVRTSRASGVPQTVQVVTRHSLRPFSLRPRALK